MVSTSAVAERLVAAGPDAPLPTSEFQVEVSKNPDLAHLTAQGLTRHHGHPVTDPAIPTRSVDHPGLFFLGYGDWCGPASATLIGVGPAARATVSALTAEIKNSASGRV